MNFSTYLPKSINLQKIITYNYQLNSPYRNWYRFLNLCVQRDSSVEHYSNVRFLDNLLITWSSNHNKTICCLSTVPDDSSIWCVYYRCKLKLKITNYILLLYLVLWIKRNVIHLYTWRRHCLFRTKFRFIIICTILETSL